VRTIPDTGLMRAGARWRAWAWPAAVCLVFGGGCGGGGVVHTVPLIRIDIQPGEPPISSIPLTESYYWTDEDGGLNIALGHRARSMLGKTFDAEWLMSIVLEALPAGSEALYRLRTREIRMVQSHGGDHRRGRSVRGVVVIEAPRDGRLSGRFHAWVSRQRFGVLTGWAPRINRAPVTIMTGRFEAVLDPVRGQRILARTEADGFDRPPAGSETRRPVPTTTQPIRWLRSRPASAAGP